MTTTVVKVIAASGGDYSTIQSWEDDCPSDLTSVDQVWEGQIRAPFNESSVYPLTFSGTTTDTTRFKRIKAEAGSSFKDNASAATNALRFNTANGVSIENTGSYGGAISMNSEPYNRVEGLQLKSTNAAVAASSAAVADAIVYIDCIMEASGYYGGAAMSDNAGGRFENCLIIATSANKCAFAGTRRQDFVNCTLINLAGSTGPGVQVDFGFPYFTNCAVFGFDSFSNDTSNIVACASDCDSPPSGVASMAFDTSTGSGFENISAGTHDFRLKSTSALIDAGDDAGTATDIIGTTRPSGAHDIGAWEYQSASSDITGTGSLAFTNAGALTGAGALSTSASLSLGSVGVLAGAGALVTAAALALTSVGALAGAGALTGADNLALASSAALSGAGALTGSDALQLAQSGALTGAGAIAGTASFSFDNTGALTGDGSLIGASAVTFSLTAALTNASSGSLSGACAIVFASDSTLSGDGALTSVAALAFNDSGAITGSGTIIGSSALAFISSGTLIGSGALAGTVSLTITDAGALSNAASSDLTGSAALAFTDAGTLHNDASQDLIGSDSLTLSDTGNLLGDGAISGNTSFAILDNGNLTGVLNASSAASLAFTDVGTLINGASSALVGTCALAITSAGTLRGAGSLVGNDYMAFQSVSALLDLTGRRLEGMCFDFSQRNMTFELSQRRMDFRLETHTCE